MSRFFKHRLPARKFKNSGSTKTPVGPGRPSRAWVRTNCNLASVLSKGRKFGVRPVLRKRRTDWTLGNTGFISSLRPYPFQRCTVHLLSTHAPGFTCRRQEIYGKKGFAKYMAENPWVSQTNHLYFRTLLAFSHINAPSESYLK